MRQLDQGKSNIYQVLEKVGQKTKAETYEDYAIMLLNC